MSPARTWGKNMCSTLKINEELSKERESRQSSGWKEPYIYITVDWENGVYILIVMWNSWVVGQHKCEETKVAIFHFCLIWKVNVLAANWPEILSTYRIKSSIMDWFFFPPTTEALSSASFGSCLVLPCTLHRNQITYKYWSVFLSISHEPWVHT